MIKSIYILVILLILAESLLTSGSMVAKAQQETPYFNVMYQVALSQHYSFFGSVDHTVSLHVKGHIQPTYGDQLQITVRYSFALTGISGLPSGAIVSALQGFYGVNNLTVTFPAGIQDFDFIIIGTINDPSILYRNVAVIPSVTVYANGPPYLPSPFGVLVPQTPGVQVYYVYPPAGPKSLTNVVLINGEPYYSIGFPALSRHIEILYQQPYRDYFVFIYLAAFAVAVPLIVNSYKTFSSNLGRAFTFANGAFASRNSYVQVRRVLRLNFRHFDHRKWLGLFIISAILMIGLAFIFGPSPVPRAYLASTPSTTPSIAPYIQAANWTYFTPLQVTGVDKFDTMSTLGAFDAVILADYPPPPDTEGISSSYHIIVLTRYVPTNYTITLQNLYPSYRLIFLSNTSMLTKTLLSIHPRANPLGIAVPSGIYSRIVLFEGVMSFVLVFFALGFLSSSIIEGSAKGLGGIAEAIGFSVFTFLFAQAVYIVTSVFLGLPVGLHASTSHDTTAVGMLGFGGGTRPRMVSGALGFLLGIISSKEARPKLDFMGFFVFLGAAIFVMIDPGNLGNLFSQLALVNLSGVPPLGTGQQAYEGIRHVIGQFMQLFGDFATVNYYSQHGAAAFYAGALPFAIFSRLSKSTATFLALFSAYVAGTGFVRIADMIPLKAMASIVPGLALGAVIILIFIGASLLESLIRRKLVNK